MAAHFSHDHRPEGRASCCSGGRKNQPPRRTGPASRARAHENSTAARGLKPPCPVERGARTQTPIPPPRGPGRSRRFPPAAEHVTRPPNHENWTGRCQPPPRLASPRGRATTHRRCQSTEGPLVTARGRRGHDRPVPARVDGAGHLEAIRAAPHRKTRGPSSRRRRSPAARPRAYISPSKPCFRSAPAGVLTIRHVPVFAAGDPVRHRATTNTDPLMLTKAARTDATCPRG